MQIPNIFTSFSPKFFLTIFSWNQSCQQLKSPNPQYFHEFSPKTIRQFFSGNQSWIIRQKWRFRLVCFYLHWQCFSWISILEEEYDNSQRVVQFQHWQFRSWQWKTMTKQPLLNLLQRLTYSIRKCFFATNC